MQNRNYEVFIILFILLTSIHLAISSPLVSPNSTSATALYWIDVGTSVVYILEFIMKTIAFGFILNGPNSYLRNKWNVLDFSIVVFSVVSLIPYISSLQIIKMFRVARIFRLISAYEGLRVGVVSILYAIPNVVRIVLFMIIFYMIFGIIALTQFQGRFSSCDTDHIKEAFEGYSSFFTVENKWDCINSGSEWVNSYYNFDNMYQSLVSLYVASMVIGWSDVMYQGARVVKVDYQSEEWTRPYLVYFFIAFMLIGSYFLNNLFVGVVVSSYNRHKEELDGLDDLTED